MRLLPCILVLAACGSRPAPASLPRTPESAADDLVVLADVLRAVHPDPFRFTTEAAFDETIAAERERLRALSAPTELDVALAFERVLAPLHDAHMRVAIPPAIADAPHAVLPFLVEIVGDEAFVDAAIDPLPRGTSLLAIDGRPIGTILSEFSALAIYEGHNDAARVRIVSEDFVRLHLLAYGARETYSLRLRDPLGEEQTVTLAATSASALSALPAQRFSRAVRGERPADPLPFLERIDATTQRLRMYTFGSRDIDAYRTRLDALAEELVGTERLIVDVRGNEGGFRSDGIALLNHLAEAPYAQWQRTAVRVRALPARYEHVLAPAFDLPLGYLEAHPRARTDGLHVREGDPLADAMRPSLPHLAPRLVVLVDGLVNSAANEFVLALRTIRPDAVFVGDEVGGACEGHFGEVPVTYTSPAYGVMVLISIVRIEHVETPGCTFGHGMMPDVSVTYDRAHYVQGADPYIEAALAAF